MSSVKRNSQQNDQYENIPGKKIKTNDHIDVHQSHGVSVPTFFFRIGQFPQKDHEVNKWALSFQQYNCALSLFGYGKSSANPQYNNYYSLIESQTLITQKQGYYIIRFPITQRFIQPKIANGTRPPYFENKKPLWFLDMKVIDEPESQKAISVIKTFLDQQDDKYAIQVHLQPSSTDYMNFVNSQSKDYQLIFNPQLHSLNFVDAYQPQQVYNQHLEELYEYQKACVNQLRSQPPEWAMRKSGFLVGNSLYDKIIKKAINDGGSKKNNKDVQFLGIGKQENQFLVMDYLVQDGIFHLGILVQKDGIQKEQEFYVQYVEMRNQTVKIDKNNYIQTITEFECDVAKRTGLNLHPHITQKDLFDQLPENCEIKGVSNIKYKYENYDDKTTYCLRKVIKDEIRGVPGEKLGCLGFGVLRNKVFNDDYSKIQKSVDQIGVCLSDNMKELVSGNNFAFSLKKGSSFKLTSSGYYILDVKDMILISNTEIDFDNQQVINILSNESKPFVPKLDKVHIKPSIEHQETVLVKAIQVDGTQSINLMLNKTLQGKSNISQIPSDGGNKQDLKTTHKLTLKSKLQGTYYYKKDGRYYNIENKDSANKWIDFLKSVQYNDRNTFSSCGALLPYNSKGFHTKQRVCTKPNYQHKGVFKLQELILPNLYIPQGNFGMGYRIILSQNTQNILSPLQLSLYQVLQSNQMLMYTLIQQTRGIRIGVNTKTKQTITQEKTRYKEFVTNNPFDYVAISETDKLTGNFYAFDFKKIDEQFIKEGKLRGLCYPINSLKNTPFPLKIYHPSKRQTFKMETKKDKIDEEEEKEDDDIDDNDIEFEQNTNDQEYAQTFNIPKNKPSKNKWENKDLTPAPKLKDYLNVDGENQILKPAYTQCQKSYLDYVFTIPTSKRTVKINPINDIYQGRVIEKISI